LPHKARPTERSRLGCSSAPAPSSTTCGHALAAPFAAREVRTQLAADGWDAPIFDVIIDIVDRRSGWLADLAAPAGRQRPRPAEPAESTSELPKPADPADSAVRVAPGQRWRDSTTTRGAVANVITIDRVDSGKVHGTYRPQGTEAIGAGVWPVREFNDFALLEDPHWPTYIVAAKIQMDDFRAIELTRVAGELEGARSHTLTRDGLGGPETSWQIVAPTEADALAIVTRVVGPDVPFVLRCAGATSRRPPGDTTVSRASTHSTPRRSPSLSPPGGRRRACAAACLARRCSSLRRRSRGCLTGRA
jgi:hypothetical protein